VALVLLGWMLAAWPAITVAQEGLPLPPLGDRPL
jgi:hypothetical protein